MLTWPAAGDTLEETVYAVQAWAHQRFEYVRDDVRWAGDPNLWVGEHWESDAELLADLSNERGIVRGDCDAFAKMCWMALRRLNVPARLVFCKAETGEGHLVCEASGWVLDNRYRIATPRQELEQLGYQWMAKSDFVPGGQWTTASA